MLGRQTLNLELKSGSKGFRCTVGGEDVASKALGKSCAIHFVQERTRRRERTRSFDLWAWCSDPCDIPKEVLLTVLEPDRELPPVNTPLALVGAQHDDPADLKAGHVYTLRNHIEVVEDLSFLRGRGSRGDRLIASSTGSLFGAMAPRTLWAKKENVLKLLEEERLRDGTGVMMMMMGIFQRDRCSGNRRHRSQSGWARSSRCRGGMDDCYSSNNKHRHSTPFRRHVWGLKPSSRWVPKAKVRSVSFADPIVTAVWPQVERHGLAEDDGGKSGSMGADILESLHSPATTTCKVNSTVDLAAVFTSIHKSLDSVRTHFPSINLLKLGTELPAITPAASPNEFTFHNCLESVLVDCSGVSLGAAHPASTRPGHQAGFLGPHRVGEDQVLVSILPGVVQDDTLDASATHDPADNNNQDLGGASPALDTETRPAQKSQLPSPPKTHSSKTQKCSIQLLDTQRTAATPNSPN
jgi:hypothetical protein